MSKRPKSNSIDETLGKKKSKISYTYTPSDSLKNKIHIDDKNV